MYRIKYIFVLISPAFSLIQCTNHSDLCRACVHYSSQDVLFFSLINPRFGQLLHPLHPIFMKICIDLHNIYICYTFSVFYALLTCFEMHDKDLGVGIKL